MTTTATKPAPKLADHCSTCVRHGQLGMGHPCVGNPCRHCPWPGCQCTHGGGCDRGWIEVEPIADDYEPAVRRCPECGRAAKDAQLLISAGH